MLQRGVAVSYKRGNPVACLGREAVLLLSGGLIHQKQISRSFFGGLKLNEELFLARLLLGCAEGCD